MEWALKESESMKRSAVACEVEVSGFGFRVSGFGFQVSGFRFRISGFELRV